MSFYKSVLRPALFLLDAERAHGVSIDGLKAGLHPTSRNDRNECLRTQIAGLDLPNPLGVAAGYDKNADVPDALLKLGFGFAEIGTVTPRPQPGNPKPRVFRLPRNRGVINRLGFNSGGHDAALSNLRKLRSKGGVGSGLIGVNIGANKDSEDFAADYVSGLKVFDGLADYFTANISSPNTPGLRALQRREALSDLLNRLCETHAGLDRKVPLFVKIAPDLSETEIDDIASVVQASSTDGLIVSNTTLDRSMLKSEVNTEEAGGLSGAPLFERSTIVLAKMALRMGSDFPLIGVGGISSAEHVLEKMRAGARAVQLYSAMVYEGPDLPKRIASGLAQHCSEAGLANLSEIVGSGTEELAKHPL